VTLKTGLGFVQGHWKWHHLIDRIRVAIVTMAISCIVYDLLVENQEFFYTPPVFSAPAGDDPVGISWRCLMLIKTQ